MPLRQPVIALALCLYTVTSVAQSTEPELETMLQGESARAMAALVDAHGGQITHVLPIINAVGARLTRGQLDSILATGEVSRHIDDLALNDQPEGSPTLDAPADCNVSGAVTIHQSGNEITWQLFNKHSSAAELNRLTLTWPAGLGHLKGLELDDRDLLTEAPASKGSADLTFERPATIAAGQEASLHFQLEHLDSGPMPPPQSQFTIRAGFRGGCETSLIPGYPDNLSDYYYSDVSGAGDLHRQGVLGSGVTVAVLDSGLWEQPRELALDSQGEPRIPARFDAIAGQDVEVAFDESGHGTHLVSALANSGKTLQGGRPTGSFRGIAPDARVIPIKAFRENGQGSMLDIVRGIQWAVDNRNRYAIRVLNLSFAARPRWPYFLDPINQAVMQAWRAGIVVIAAAGNEGPELMTIGSPGNTPYIITVGAVTDSWTPTDRADDYIPDFSSRGPTPEAHIKPDIVAPGGHITGLIRPGSGLTLEHPEYLLDPDTFVLTGSSQAAAIVSGLTALLLQLEPELSPDDVKCKLLTGADPAINSDGKLAYSPFEQGQGYANVIRAVLIGERGCGNTGLDIDKDLAMQEHFEGPSIVDSAGNITLPNLNQILSPIPAAKGHSDTRAWGIKAHIEREAPDPAAAAAAEPPLDWELLYELERERVEKIQNAP
ncbi:S8 family peptidase [Haliea sp. E17]|uniref:S8 family peptidase n=1 Tax=Haliea sp. E17 TaxID=3401576 RepID=UPI003AAFFCED